MRYLVPGMLDRLSAINFDPDHPQVIKIVDLIIKRVRSAGQAHASHEETKHELMEIIERWRLLADKYRNTGKNLEYWARLRPFDNRPVNPHLMRAAEDRFDDPEVWPTPNSMREVEPSAFYTEWRTYSKSRKTE